MPPPNQDERSPEFPPSSEPSSNEASVSRPTRPERPLSPEDQLLQDSIRWGITHQAILDHLPLTPAEVRGFRALEAKLGREPLPIPPEQIKDEPAL